MNGCGEKCATRTHNLSPIDTLRYHEHFDSLSQMAKKQWLLDYFIMTSSSKEEQIDMPLLICGKEVCLPLWLATLGISQSYYYSVRTLFLRGHKRLVSQVHRNPTQRTSEAIAWMDNFVSLMGDKMPDRATTHLPSCLSKLSVYQRMASELKERGRSKIVSQSQFFELWRTQFHHVTIPKVRCVCVYTWECKQLLWFFKLTFSLSFPNTRRTDSQSVMFVSYCIRNWRRQLIGSNDKR